MLRKQSTLGSTLTSTRSSRLSISTRPGTPGSPSSPIRQCRAVIGDPLTRLDRCSACRAAETGLNAQGICMVGSTDASDSRLARVGRIDRRTFVACSRLDATLYACHPRLVNGYLLVDV